MVSAYTSFTSISRRFFASSRVGKGLRGSGLGMTALDYGALGTGGLGMTALD